MKRAFHAIQAAGLVISTLVWHNLAQAEPLYQLKVYCSQVKKKLGISHNANTSLPIFKDTTRSPILGRYDETRNIYRVSSETLQYLNQECSKMLGADTSFTLMARDFSKPGPVSLKHKIEVETEDVISRSYSAVQMKNYLAMVSMVRNQWQEYLAYVADVYMRELDSIAHPDKERIASQFHDFFANNLAATLADVSTLRRTFISINSYEEFATFLADISTYVSRAYRQVIADTQSQVFYPSNLEESKKLRSVITQAIVELLIINLREPALLSLSSTWGEQSFIEKMKSNLLMSDADLELFTRFMAINRIATTRMSSYIKTHVFAASSSAEGSYSSEHHSLSEPASQGESLPSVVEKEKKKLTLPPPPPPPPSRPAASEKKPETSVPAVLPSKLLPPPPPPPPPLAPPVVNAPASASAAAPIPKEASLPPIKKLEVPPPPSVEPANDREALLAEIRKGVKLRSVSEPTGKSKKPPMKVDKKSVREKLEIRRKAIEGASSDDEV